MPSFTCPQIQFSHDLFETHLIGAEWDLLAIGALALDPSSPFLPHTSPDGQKGSFVRRILLKGLPLIQGASEDLALTMQLCYGAMGRLAPLEGYPSAPSPSLVWEDRAMRAVCGELAQELATSAQGYARLPGRDLASLEACLWEFEVRFEWEIRLKPSAPLEWNRYFYCTQCGAGPVSGPVPISWQAFQGWHSAKVQEAQCEQAYCAYRSLILDTHGGEALCPDCENEEAYTCQRHAIEAPDEQALQYMAEVLGYHTHTP